MRHAGAGFIHRLSGDLLYRLPQIRFYPLRPTFAGHLISALRAAFGGCAPKRACGRSPKGRGKGFSYKNNRLWVFHRRLCYVLLFFLDWGLR